MSRESTVMIYVTCKDEEEAVSVSKALIGERLVACSNMWPIRSLYRWEGKLQDDREVALLMKSRAELADRAVERIKELHSYEVPCVEVVKVDGGSADYLRWVREETEGG